jgi:hypothetical protein
MFRAKWTTILVAALSCAGLVVAQAPSSVPRVVTIQEAGKPALQCRVLKTWSQGAEVAFEVEVLATGEHITLVEGGPVQRHAAGGKVVQEVRSKIYHWVHNSPPPGAPVAPPDAIVPGTPRSGVQFASPSLPPVVPAPSASAAVAAPAPRAPSALPASPPVATVTPVPPPPLAVVKPVGSASAAKTDPKSAVASTDAKAAPAKPSDWHQSWGKADDHKSKTDEAQTAVAGVQPASQMPAKVALPQAAKDGPDPLDTPDVFSPYHLKHKDDNMPTIQVTPGEGVANEVKKTDDDPLKLDDDPKKEDDVAKKDDGAKKDDSVAKKDEKKEPEKIAAGPKADGVTPESDKKDTAAAKPAKKPESTPRLSERLRGLFTRKDDKPKTAPKPDDPNMEGMGSVYAACEAAGMPKAPPGAPLPVPTPPELVETDPSNAFTTVVKTPRARPAPPSEQANAFDGSRPAMPPSMGSAMPPMPPRGYAGMPPMPPSGPMPAYGMAPPPPGMMPPAPYAQVPMPAYGQAPPTGVMAVGYGNPARPGMMDRGPSAPPVVATQPPPVGDPSQLVLILRSSLFPSNREWAADQLGGPEWRGHAVVVEMLVQSAKNDPAATVREACVRNLGRSNGAMPCVVDAITAAQKDEDEGVRNEATKTLAKLQGGGTRSPIQPASVR